MTEAEEWTITLPEDVSRQLESLDDERVDTIISQAVRDALDMAESAEEKREALRETMGIDGRDSEELDESLSEVEQRQAELRRKMGPR